MKGTKPKVLDPLEALALFLIQRTPRMHKSEICRAINRKPNNRNSKRLYCRYKKCYANPRIRAEEPEKIQKPNCMISKGKVFYAIDKLVKKGLILVNREKKPDGREKRKWDYFSCCYSTLNIALGGL